MVATCGALAMAFKRLNQRDSVGYQRWLRARVLAQGFTIAAIVAAGFSEFGTDVFKGKKVITPAPPHEQKAFELRMKEAEEAHRAETLSDRGVNVESAAPVQRPSDDARMAEVNRSAEKPHERTPSQSWLSWIGLSKS